MNMTWKGSKWKNCDSVIYFEWLVNKVDDELMTQADDSWSFQQDLLYSSIKIGLDIY